MAMIVQRPLIELQIHRSFNILTCCPTSVLPVKDRSLIFGSDAIAFPISAPPLHKVATAVGNPFCFNTLSTILIVAMDTNEVVGAPFQITVSPQTWNQNLHLIHNIPS